MRVAVCGYYGHKFDKFRQIRACDKFGHVWLMTCFFGQRPLHEAVEINCEKGPTTEHKEQISNKWAKG